MRYGNGRTAALRQLGLEKTALDGPGYGQTFAGPRTLREAGQQAGVAGLMGAGFLAGAHPAARTGFMRAAQHMAGYHDNPVMSSTHNLARLEPLMDGSIAYRKARNEGASVGTALSRGAAAALPTAANLVVPGRLPGPMVQNSLVRQGARDFGYWDQLQDVRNGGTGVGDQIGAKIRGSMSR